MKREFIRFILVGFLSLSLIGVQGRLALAANYSSTSAETYSDNGGFSNDYRTGHQKGFSDGEFSGYETGLKEGVDKGYLKAITNISLSVLALASLKFIYDFFSKKKK